MSAACTRGESQEFLRDQWKNWVGVLSRIKQDEQRWLSVAFLVFGGLFGVAVGAVGRGLLVQGDGVKSVLALLMFLGVTHVAAWVWALQALVLRKQYYRTMARNLLVQWRLGSPPDPEWRAGFDNWYKDATRPSESHSSDGLILASLVAAFRLLLEARDLCPGQLFCGTVLLGVLSYFHWIWVRGRFQRRDRTNMKDLYEEDLVRKLGIQTC